MVDDSSWEPDGVTLQVRFCEGGSAYHENEIAAATLQKNGLSCTYPEALGISGLQPEYRFQKRKSYS